MIHLRRPLLEDADPLFPLVYQSPVTETIQWDGPASLDSYRQGMAERVRRRELGENHSWVIEALPAPGAPPLPIGMSDIRPYPGEHNRGDIGLFIGQPYQGQGHGTAVIRCLVEYGFTRLGLEKIEAFIFVGNHASRKIFEKNGFLLEGTIRKAAFKRGRYLDEWLMGITWEDYIATPYWIVHLCPQQRWLAAGRLGEYRAGSLAQEGFMHASTPSQIATVANAYYAGQPDLVLLWIDPNRLQADLRWEPGIPPHPAGPAATHGTGQLFPHLYGPLNLDAVFTVTDYSPGADGLFPEQPLPMER